MMIECILDFFFQNFLSYISFYALYVRIDYLESETNMLFIGQVKVHFSLDSLVI